MDPLASRCPKSLAHLLAAYFAVCLLVCCTASPSFAQVANGAAPSVGSSIPREIKYAGDKACDRCHAEISRSFQKTAMGRASGPAKGNLIPGEFTHPQSRVHYKVYEKDGRAWLSFDREGYDALHGMRELLYYIGSGGRGRTYLFCDSGFFFEAPVNWYAQKSAWDMTPAYQETRTMPLNLPLESSCLTCHVSSPQSPFRGTQSEYREPLITQQGIGCERCHGPGSDHVEKMGPIVNPARLSADRRDDVCMQCHLEGNVTVRQPGRELNQFRPGDNLQDYVHYFVLAGAARDFRAASQFESFYQSKCKLKSGDSFTCTTCHDPHSSPAPSEKVAFYRSKCVACHTVRFAAKHHRDNPDCISCHMPRIPSSDVAHTQATDHRILARPGKTAETPPAPVEPDLKRFPPAPATDPRDLALAWQTLAEGGMQSAVAQSQKFLPQALAEHPGDPDLLTALGYFHETHGEPKQARDLFAKALQSDPFADVAATDLGVLEARAGDLAQAIRLWKPVFAREPGRSAIGMNLGMALCAHGELAEARATIERVLEFNPDLPQARKLQHDLEQSPPDCGLH